MLSDSNADLIATYRAIRCSVDGVIARLSQYQYGKEAYYVARASSPSHALDSAARFIYLNRACWNGLYRVNQRGRFNVPFGRFARPTICDPPRLRCVADALASADVRCDDFEAVVGGAWLGDFVYLDPPYITGHTGNGFHKYNARLFSWIDQDRLARVACKLRDKGVHVLVSNAADARVVHLYKGFYHYRVRRRSLMAGTASARGIVTEALLSSYPLLGCSTEVIE